MVISTVAIAQNPFFGLLLLNATFSSFTVSGVVAPTETKIKGLSRLLSPQGE